MIKKGLTSLLSKTVAPSVQPIQATKSLITHSVRCFAGVQKLQKFDYLDPLCLEDLLTDEEKMIRDSARQYAQSKLMPRVRDAYNKEHFDTTIMREMGEQGFLGCTCDEYGLPGVSSTAYGLINREVERVDSGYRSALSVQSSLVMYPIYTYANKAVKDALIPKLATGEYIGCFGLTEPNHGSDPGSMETRAKDMSDHYLLNGSKTWITNSPHADVFVIWAQDDNKEISGYVLTRDMKGISTPKIEGKHSLRASTTGMIMLDDVRVPKENMLNVKGLKGPFSCLNQARYGNLLKNRLQLQHFLPNCEYGPPSEEVKGKFKETMKGMFDTKPKNSENFHASLLKSLDDNKARYDRGLYTDWVMKVYAKCTNMCIKMDDFEENIWIDKKQNSSTDEAAAVPSRLRQKEIQCGKNCIRKFDKGYKLFDSIEKGMFQSYIKDEDVDMGEFERAISAQVEGGIQRDIEAGMNSMKSGKL